MSELAVEGGPPVRSEMLPYGRQVVDESDIQAVVAVLRSEWITTGPAVSAFEEAFAVKVGAKYAVAVSSGTAALHAAAFGVGLRPGQEAIIPALTFVATANCVLYQGASVVFADVRADTLNLDPSQVQACLTPRTRAIISVDYAGQPADGDELSDIAERHRLTLIHDASHALGATYRGRSVGARRHLNTFSLHPVKHITTGEGGVVTTDDPALAARLRAFRSHGIMSDYRQRESAGTWFYEMADLGYNYRLTDFQCALGLSQLRKLESWIARRREIAAKYTEAFALIPEIEPPTVLPDRIPAWHLYVIKLRLELLRVGRAEIFKALRAENIGVHVHYIPVPWHPYYQGLGYKKGDWPVAENEYERLITLPIYSAMTAMDVEDVITAVKKVIFHFRL